MDNNMQETKSNYVFQDQELLPVGEVKLKIVRGHAWVFTDEGNFIMHTGEERTITTNDDAPRIRSAYATGAVHYDYSWSSN